MTFIPCRFCRYHDREGGDHSGPCLRHAPVPIPQEGCPPHDCAKCEDRITYGWTSSHHLTGGDGCGDGEFVRSRDECLHTWIGPNKMRVLDHGADEPHTIDAVMCKECYAHAPGCFEDVTVINGTYYDDEGDPLAFNYGWGLHQYDADGTISTVACDHPTEFLSSAQGAIADDDDALICTRCGTVLPSREE